MKPYDRAARVFEALQGIAPNGTQAQGIHAIEQAIIAAVEDCQIVERAKDPNPTVTEYRTVLEHLEGLLRDAGGIFVGPADSARAILGKKDADLFCDKCGYSGPISHPHPRRFGEGMCNYAAGPKLKPECQCAEVVLCPLHWGIKNPDTPYPGYKPQPIREDFEQQEARIAHNRTAESNHLKRQIQTANNLLAVMHRDGGHHTGEHGFKQSCLDAEKKYYSMVREIIALKSLPEKVTALAYQVIDGVTGEQKKHVGSIIKLCDKDLNKKRGKGSQG